MKQLTLQQLQQMANRLRQDIIAMLLKAGSGHAAGPLGLADIFAALYFSVLRHDPKNPDWNERDLLVLSNGHCVPIRYAAMSRSGYFDLSELDTLRKFGSRLQGHPERLRLPGLETTSGPLGSGLSQAAGMALALKMDHSRRWVYCVMSDGEFQEGNTWEAIMLGAKYELANLIAIVDRNNIQISGQTEDVMPLEDLAAKWESFGWHVIEVDGHNIQSFIDACSLARAIENRPSVIIAHTIPGKGVDFMEYDFLWHGAAPKDTQAKLALKELRTLGGKIRNEQDD
ncbi:MAG: transketolase [Candidatus Woesebacteria bacterium]|jgi:transketolase